jgi:hypothetical protein
MLYCQRQREPIIVGLVSLAKVNWMPLVKANWMPLVMSGCQLA